MRRTKFKSTRTSSIYLIQSLHNNKIYVGSSSQMPYRIKRHKSMLMNGNHDNSRLQNHVNKYGLKDLKFKILEICEVKNLLLREQYWIDILPSEFNICKQVGFTVRGLRWTNKTSMKGKKHPMYGIPMPKEQKLQNKLWMDERWKSEEFRKRMSEIHKGQIPWNKGKNKKKEVV